MLFEQNYSLRKHTCFFAKAAQAARGERRYYSARWRVDQNEETQLDALLHSLAAKSAGQTTEKRLFVCLRGLRQSECVIK